MNATPIPYRPSPVARRVLTAVLALATLLGLGACSRGTASDTVAAGDVSVVHDAPADPGVGTTPDTTTPAPTATTSVNAQLTSGPVIVRADSSDTAAPVTTLQGKTALGSKTTLLVIGERDGWIEVALPIRPNGSSGWIPTRVADLRANPMAVTVDRGGHHLVVTRDGQVELETTVAVGSHENPTPSGDYFITDLVETESPGGAYGPFALGLSGHSETLSEFAGGDGQLGLHGTNDPSSIGRSVSHGCVRVGNDVVSKLVKLLPLGTPVTVA